MTEDEFRRAVLAGFDSIDGRLDGIDGRLDHLNGRIEGLYMRLNDQDDIIERLTGKVDRLRGDVARSAEASEQAITGLNDLTRRVSRLENPDVGPTPDAA